MTDNLVLEKERVIYERGILIGEKEACIQGMIDEKDARLRQKTKHKTTMTRTGARSD